MTIGSLFSGIGGLELGLEMCGLGPVIWQAESDPYARAVLAKHWPSVHRYEDVRHIDARAARPDVLCGGFPCQDLSSAGKRRGLGAERSGLWWEYRRIVRTLRPSLVFIENVAHTWARWLPVVRRSLWKVGYASLPLRVSAAEAGALHERARLFVLAYPLGVELRQQPGRSGGQDGTGAPVPRLDGSARDMAHADGARLEERVLEPARQERAPSERSRLPNDPWASEPDVGRVAHGVAARVDRLRCLGNACVPQQAALAWRTLIERRENT